MFPLWSVSKVGAMDFSGALIILTTDKMILSRKNFTK
jgi:hypothetical protein